MVLVERIRKFFFFFLFLFSFILPVFCFVLLVLFFCLFFFCSVYPLTDHANLCPFTVMDTYSQTFNAGRMTYDEMIIPQH